MKSKKIEKILTKSLQNIRIDKEEALELLNEAELLDLAHYANEKRKALHKKKIVTFVIDRNINYTNICKSGCLFCAFYKSNKEEKGAYLISKEELSKKIEETKDLKGTQILLQGGINPDLDLDYYLNLLKFIKTFNIHIHGFSPPEIFSISQKSNLTISETLEKLIDAGLGSIPGGGAEILVDKIREKISPGKCNSKEWLNVMEEAHKLGLKTSATMMFGHIESNEDIISHLDKLRNLQDKTGGFTAFIPWTFQPKNTKLDNVIKKSPLEYLRVLSISRLFFDNIKNIQTSWVTQKDKIAQLSLFFGANDFGSTMIEENVVRSAGVSYMLPKEKIVSLIKEAGFKPVQRDCFYNLFE